MIYLGTDDRVLSPDDLDKLTTLTAFARSQGWDLKGAFVVPFDSDASARRKQLHEDWKNDVIDAVIVWDAEVGYPTVWTDDFPVLD
ncbi:hypothetical protein ACF05W_03255 [Streptomyces lydicus]|uniref:hypothetical protein n=1 Tax=Streptomyces lydicus TaxID=47763 RepID=UPI0036F58F91